MTLSRVTPSQAHEALHALWTGYVGTPGYDKEMWISLSNAIGALEHEVLYLRDKLDE